MDSSALVLFVDIYGFARFVEPEEVFTRPVEFMTAFRDSVRKHFHTGERVDDLECGAMVVRELSSDGANADQSVAELLNTIKRVDADFVELCKQFTGQIKRPASLHLGWSIVRGYVRTDEPVEGASPPQPPRGTVRICSRSPSQAA